MNKTPQTSMTQEEAMIFIPINFFLKTRLNQIQQTGDDIGDEEEFIMRETDIFVTALYAEALYNMKTSSEHAEKLKTALADKRLCY